MIDGIAYMNSGDWVESLTALVETHQGEWQIIEFPLYNLKAELNEILGEAVAV
jgi:hypothetical protein